MHSPSAVPRTRSNWLAWLASGNVSVTGSSVVSDSGADIQAGRDLTVQAAQNTHQSSHFQETKKSGLFGSGGVGFTIGTQQQSTDQQGDTKTAAASTIGSVGGSVWLQAAKNYTQTGSDVIAPQGDIDINAQQVNINEARETSRQSTEQKFKQSGLTIAITSPVISAVQTVQQMSQAASDTKDSRMKALAAASAGFAGKEAADAIKAGQGSTINGKEGQILTGKTNPDGSPESRDANAADKVGGINLSISIGSSKSQSNTTQSSDSARGSSVQAAKQAALNAQNQIRLQAAKNTAEQRSSNKSSSGSIGISIGTSGFGVTLSASQGRGNADGSDLTWSNTHIDAGQRASITSGGDATVKGAVVSAPQVTAQVGTSGQGDLNIESLQRGGRVDPLRC